MLLRHHSQTKRAESLSCKMLMTLRALPRVRYFIYLNLPVGCMHFFKEEKDLVILPDAFFLHPLVVQDMFNIPRTWMEMERRPSVFYIVSLCIWKLTCWPSLTASGWTLNGTAGNLIHVLNCQLQSPNRTDTDLFIFSTTSAEEKALELRSNFTIKRFNIFFVFRIDSSFIWRECFNAAKSWEVVLYFLHTVFQYFISISLKMAKWHTNLKISTNIWTTHLHPAQMLSEGLSQGRGRQLDLWVVNKGSALSQSVTIKSCVCVCQVT